MIFEIAELMIRDAFMSQKEWWVKKQGQLILFWANDFYVYNIPWLEASGQKGLLTPLPYIAFIERPSWIPQQAAKIPLKFYCIVRVVSRSFLLLVDHTLKFINTYCLTKTLSQTNDFDMWELFWISTPSHTYESSMTTLSPEGNVRKNLIIKIRI